MSIEVEIYEKIRHLHEHEGKSQREISKILGISRNTVKKYYEGTQVPWERQGVSGRQRYVVTDEVLEFIKSCLASDETENIKKQRHTAKRIYDLLVEFKNFEGGETTIREIVAELKGKQAKVFIPLSYDPGEAIQIDWGEATVYIQGKKVKINLFCMRECYSADMFCKAFYRQNEESFLEGQISGFSIDDLNAELLRRCLKYRNHKIAGREQTVGEMAITTKVRMTQLPKYRFDSSKCITSRVSEFSTVRFDYNHYSVPFKYVDKEVSVKGYGNEVVMVHRNTEIARYSRCYERGQTQYRLEHYIDLIERRPRSVFNAKPVKDNISAELIEIGKRLSGPREMVKLLRLCIDYGEANVMTAIGRLKSPTLSVEQIQAYLLQDTTPPERTYPSIDIKVLKPRFDKYDALMNKGVMV